MLEELGLDELFEDFDNSAVVTKEYTPKSEIDKILDMSDEQRIVYVDNPLETIVWIPVDSIVKNIKPQPENFDAYYKATYKGGYISYNGWINSEIKE
jgi:hypothetical protein